MILFYFFVFFEKAQAACKGDLDGGDADEGNVGLDEAAIALRPEALLDEHRGQGFEGPEERREAAVDPATSQPLKHLNREGPSTTEKQRAVILTHTDEDAHKKVPCSPKSNFSLSLSLSVSDYFKTPP